MKPSISVYEPGHLDKELHPNSLITFSAFGGVIDVYIEHGALKIVRNQPFCSPLAVIPQASNIIKIAI